MNLCDPRQVRELLRGFHFSKSKGQNFLMNANIIKDIAAASEADESCGVLEIGAGIGALTVQLAERAGKVITVELDTNLLPILNQTLAPYSNIEVIPMDILKLDLNHVIDKYFAGLRPIVCANLPYNITTPVLTKLIGTSGFQAITVLLQKEVARRLSAPQGSSGGGAFSLFLQYHMHTQLLFEVPRDKFMPVPKVDSALLRCIRREKPAIQTADETFFFRIVRGGFLLRRKTLVNSLSAALPEFSKEEIRQAVHDCGFSENIRGEALTLQDFSQLANLLRYKIH